MEKIIEQFLNNTSCRNEEALKDLAVSSLEAGVPWNGD